MRGSVCWKEEAQEVSATRGSVCWKEEAQKVSSTAWTMRIAESEDLTARLRTRNF
jgi:hypothetical protein